MPNNPFLDFEVKLTVKQLLALHELDQTSLKAKLLDMIVNSTGSTAVAVAPVATNNLVDNRYLVNDEAKPMRQAASKASLNPWPKEIDEVIEEEVEEEQEEVQVSPPRNLAIEALLNRANAAGGSSKYSDNRGEAFPVETDEAEEDFEPQPRPVRKAAPEKYLRDNKTTSIPKDRTVDRLQAIHDRVSKEQGSFSKELGKLRI